MLLDQLWLTIPALQIAMGNLPLIEDREAVWVLLRRLMTAHAPSTGVTLPGAVFDEITDIAAAFGLADRLDANLAGVGSGGLWVGVEKERADVVVIAHLDRPSFRVQSLDDPMNPVVFPLCSDCVSGKATYLPGKALRYNPDRGQLEVSARGQLFSLLDDDAHVGEQPPLMIFHVESGIMSWLDTVTFDYVPTRQNDLVQGSGLDNGAGVLIALGAAAILRQIEETLLEHNRRCLFVFADQYAGTPEMLGSNGMAMMVPPLLGSVIVDGQWIPASPAIRQGSGIAYTFATVGERSLIVPPHYQQLTYDLAEAFNQRTPQPIAQHHRRDASLRPPDATNRGRILGIMGAPLSRGDLGQEQVSIRDVQAGIGWLGCFLALTLSLVPEAAARYTLGR